MTIRKADVQDLEQILSIYSYAREQMALSGNPSQWGTEKPDLKTIRQDIEQGRLFVMESELENALEKTADIKLENAPEETADIKLKDAPEETADIKLPDASGRQIAGVFAFHIGEEPTYQIIQGRWLNDFPYGVIHRIASAGRQKDILAECLTFCSAFTCNLRIDTHENNLIMRHLLKKNGFQECGIIHVEDKSPRIAFQRCIE